MHRLAYLLPILLSACQSDAAREADRHPLGPLWDEGASSALALGEGQLAPPGSLVLSSTAWSPGYVATLTVPGVPPGTRVFFAASGAGPGNGPCPPVLGGLCISLVNPRVLGNATANAAGVATLNFTVPDIPIDTIYLQAAHGGPTPATSQGVVVDLLRDLDADDDGDGLTVSQELTLGTNPSNPDTDQDGVWDGDEANGGRDPLDPNDGYIGGWPFNPDKSAIPNPGFGAPLNIGGIFPRGLFHDQFDDQVDVYDFAGQGKLTIFTTSAMWSPICVMLDEWAGGLNQVYDPAAQELVLTGQVQWVDLLIDASAPGQYPTLADRETWDGRTQALYPVMTPTSPDMLQWLSTGAYPTLILVNDQMQILDFGDPASVLATAVNYTNGPVDTGEPDSGGANPDTGLVPEADCSDGADNNGDLLADCADPTCADDIWCAQPEVMYGFGVFGYDAGTQSFGPWALDTAVYPPRLDFNFSWANGQGSCIIQFEASSAPIPAQSWGILAPDAVGFDFVPSTVATNCVFGPYWPDDLVNRLAGLSYGLGVFPTAHPQAPGELVQNYPSQHFGAGMLGDLAQLVPTSTGLWDPTWVGLAELGTTPLPIVGALAPASDVFAGGVPQSGSYLIYGRYWDANAVFSALP